MFRFENIDFWYLFLAVPLLLILFLINRVRRKGALGRFGDISMLSQLMPGVSKYKVWVKFVLIIISLAGIILGIMKPQFGTKLQELKREGVEVIIALDISNSMLAEDIKPNRLERAKRMIDKMIDKMYNDKIGLVMFAGESFLNLPLTTDYSAAKLLVSSVTTDLIPSQGTAIGSAIELSMESFSEDETSKVLIIITDGENHEDDAINRASEAAEKGIYIHTVGMGSRDGGPIPEYINGRRVGFKKDNSGNTIITKLDESMLSQLSSTANGNFFRADANDVDLSKVIDKINDLEKTEFETKKYSDYDDKFQYALFVGLFFLIFDIIISERKNKFISNLFSFEGKR